MCGQGNRLIWKDRVIVCVPAGGRRVKLSLREDMAIVLYGGFWVKVFTKGHKRAREWKSVKVKGKVYSQDEAKTGENT
ncbi:hypothetical protein Tco_0837578 [Tanacetum coccineum]